MYICWVFSCLMRYMYIKAWKTSPYSWKIRREGRRRKTVRCEEAWCAVLFFVLCFPPRVPTCGGKSVPRVAQVCWPGSAGWATGRDGFQLPWAPARALRDLSFLCRGAGDVHVRNCRMKPPFLVDGWRGPDPQEKGQEAASPADRVLGSGLKACWPLDCNGVRSNFGRFRFVQGKIPAELHLINQNLEAFCLL